VYKPYKKPIVKASPDIILPEPRISKLTILLVRICARFYFYIIYGIARIIIHRKDRDLYHAMQRALAGKSRCIIALRHPNGGEPQILTWFFLFKLRFMAILKGVRFKRPPHAVFIYSYEVARYGGWVVRYVMPNLGAMPIHHAKMDSQGMTRIYNAITNGPYPVALAPEGRVSFTTNTIPRLEPGVVRIGFNAALRLAEKDPDCSVEILPVSIYYYFGFWGKLNLEILLKKIERACGISGKKGERKKIPFRDRVIECRAYILEVNERRYKVKSDPSLPFEESLNNLVIEVLRTAEEMTGLKSEGDITFRIHRIRQIFWDKIFLPGVRNLKQKTPMERYVANLLAGEAWYLGRHLELVDFGWHFRNTIPENDAPLHDKIEFAQNLWDFASRTMGGAYMDRVNIFPRRVIIKSSPIINLSEKLSSYKEDKKAAVSIAMQDLEKSFLDCIAESGGWLAKKNAGM